MKKKKDAYQLSCGRKQKQAAPADSAAPGDSAATAAPAETAELPYHSETNGPGLDTSEDGWEPLGDGTLFFGV